MIESARQRILATLPDEARVLDVGGWAVPFPRADAVLDLLPYETRGQWGYDGDPGAERFDAASWVQRDICDREPWPFADGEFDFAICSHTLEDVRDPVWVCSELNRVARAGYVEVPSRLVEQTWNFQGPWAGYSHHHWLVDVDQEAASISFTFKFHEVHAPECRFPFGYEKRLEEADRVQSLWWEGGFAYGERIFADPAELRDYLRSFVLANGGADDGAAAGGRLRGLRRRLGGP